MLAFHPEREGGQATTGARPLREAGSGKYPAAAVAHSANSVPPAEPSFPHSAIVNVLVHEPKRAYACGGISALAAHQPMTSGAPESSEVVLPAPDGLRQYKRVLEYLSRYGIR